jgi:hypothetical protein
VNQLDSWLQNVKVPFGFPFELQLRPGSHSDMVLPAAKHHWLMSVKSVLPWLCVLASLAGVAALYSSNQSQSAELARLRAESQDYQTLRATVEATKQGQSQAESEELARLRKENEELLRLRNEVRQLRNDKQQLSRQAQAAEAQAQNAQAQAQQAQAQAQAVQAQAQAQAVQAQAQAQRTGAGGVPQPLSLAQVQANACVNNLRQIDAAKQQWALENKKPANVFPTPTDLAPYLKNGLPLCPASGTYTLNAVGQRPTCNVPGHALGP